MRSDQSHRVRRATGPRRAVALVAMIAAALVFGGTLPSTTTLAGGPGDSVRQGLELLVREDPNTAARDVDGRTRNCAVADSPTGRQGPDAADVTGDAGSAPEPGAAPHGDGSTSGTTAPPHGDRSMSDITAAPHGDGATSGLAGTQCRDGDGRGSLRPWSLLRQLGVSLFRSWF
ncbi:hypothetical protein AB0M43_04110 [Longispora sp. NPDC051575]|uniref:hypothetical protein n=1 Tax=Longispora sp. NPDC051575 TaxID=3154943 RepID=UPI0034383D16